MTAPAPAAERTHQPITGAMVWRLLCRLRPWRREYALVCGIGIVIAALEMLPPRLVGQAVDRISRRGVDLGSILTVAAEWAAVTAAAQLLAWLQIGTATRTGELVLSTLRLDIFTHLQRLSLAYFDKNHVGRIISRVANDLDTLRAVLIWGLNTVLANAVVMLIAGAMIYRTDARLFFAVAWLAPVMTVMNYIYSRHVGLAWQSVRRHVTKMNSAQAENIAGVRVVAAFNRQAQNLSAYSVMQRTNTRNCVAASTLSGAFQPGLIWIRFLGQGIILLYGGFLAAQHSLSAGDLVAACLYRDWVMQPAVNLGLFINDMMIAMAGSERLFALLDEQPEVCDLPAARPLPSLRGDVEFRGVSFAYAPGRPILHQLDFCVKAGQTVALVGATGSGKSTIISLLSRFYAPQTGQILLDGHDLAGATAASLRSQMAVVLQANHLFSGSVLDNLRYGRPGASLAEIHAAATLLGCHERFLRLRDGYDTSVGERGGALSLGERQLICFTRALVADPRILLLDEATSAVDSATELQLQTALQRLCTGRTTFIVAHRLSTITSADLILVLEKGQVIERGRHHELLSRGGKYSELDRHSKIRPLCVKAGNLY